jgi:hypothetical protein
VILLVRGGDDRPAGPAATPTPGAEAEQELEPAPSPGDTQVQETDGRLAIGITEPNPELRPAPWRRRRGRPVRPLA